MAGILQFLEDAIQPAVAARAGYLQGQTAKSQAQAALARQSALDQINEAVKSAQVQADLARANRDDNYMPPPKTVTTDKGIMQWDPNSQTYKPTGMSGPEKTPISSPKTVVRQDGHIMQWDPTGQKWNDTGIIARASGADATGDGTDGGITPAQSRRIAATKAKLDEDLKFTPRPSKAPDAPKPAQTITTPSGQTITAGGNPAGPLYTKAMTDSVAYDTGTIQPDRKAYEQALGGGAPLPVGTGGAGAGTPAPEDITGEYQQAAEAYKAAVASGQNPDQARALYGQIVTAIAKKHGFIQ